MTEKSTTLMKIVPSGTSEETLLDKVQLLSDALGELKSAVSDLTAQLVAEKDKLYLLRDEIGMSSLEYDSFRHTGKLPPQLLRRKQAHDSDAQQLKLDADALLEAVGLSRGQYDLHKNDGQIDWDQSAVGRNLNKLISDVEKTTTETTDLLENQ